LSFKRHHFDQEVRRAYGEFLSNLEMLRTVASDGSVKVVSNTPHVPIKAMPEKVAQTRSFGYGQYPARPSKKVRTAVGR
jgi:hypothetical protein